MSRSAVATKEEGGTKLTNETRRDGTHTHARAHLLLFVGHARLLHGDDLAVELLHHGHEALLLGLARLVEMLLEVAQLLLVRLLPLLDLGEQLGLIEG